MLFSSMRPFISYAYWGLRAVINFNVSNSNKCGINKLTSDSGSEASTTPGTIKISQKLEKKKISLVN